MDLETRNTQLTEEYAPQALCTEEVEQADANESYWQTIIRPINFTETIGYNLGPSRTR